MNRRQKNKNENKYQPLPRGMEQFHAWSERIIGSSGLPVNDSTKFAVAVQIMHAKEDADYLPDEYFIRRLRKGAANQVAAYFCNEVKAKQEAAIAEQKIETKESV